VRYDAGVSAPPPSYRPLKKVSFAIWTDERGLSVFMALLAVWLFVIPHFQPRTGEGSLSGDLFLTVLLLTGASAVSMQRALRMLVISVALLAVTLRLLDGLFSADAAAVGRLGSYAISAALLALIVLFRVFAGGTVNKHRILGAVSGYLLIGVTWATLYSLVDTVNPGAFSQSAGSGDRRDWIYYSFVTLTTVGYGDITPIHSVARTLAILEALIGQLYPAILIARLVSQGFARPR